MGAAAAWTLARVVTDLVWAIFNDAAVRGWANLKSSE
jgi:hypothetical protein